MGVSCYHLLMTSTCSRRETGTRFCTCAPSNYVCVHTCACVFSSNKTEKSTKQKRTIFPPPQGPSEIQPALDCLLLVLSEWYSLLHGQKRRQMILVLDKKKTFITRLSHLLRAHVCVCFHMYVGACVCGGHLRVMLGGFTSGCPSSIWKQSVSLNKKYSISVC